VRCAGGGYPPPAAGPSLPHVSLAHGQDMLSMGKSAIFLPAGKNFAIPAFDFLPVGNGLRSSTEKMTKHHEGRQHRHYRGKAVVRPSGWCCLRTRTAERAINLKL
jgi:hypothetical protein